MLDTGELIQQQQRRYSCVGPESGAAAAFAELEVEPHFRWMPSGPHEQDERAQGHHHDDERRPIHADPRSRCLIWRNLARARPPSEQFGDALEQSGLRLQVIVEHPLIPSVLESVEQEAAGP